MKIDKSKLDFLKLYGALSETQTRLGDKIKIFSKKDDGVYFLVCTKNANLTYKLSENVDEIKDFELIFNLSDFTSLISKIPNDSFVDIDINGIKFNKNGTKYTLDTFDIEFPIFDDSLNSDKVKTFILKNLNYLDALKNYTGDKKLDAVVVIDGYYFSSDRRLGCIVKTDTNLNGIIDRFYIPRIVCNYIQKFEVEELEIKVNIKEEIWGFILNGITAVIPMQVYSLPNLLEEPYINMYDHKLFIQLEKDAFKNALNRMSVVSNKNPDSRIYISFEKNKIIIESRDYNMSREEIDCDVREEFIGKFIIVSSLYLQRIVNDIGDKKEIKLCMAENPQEVPAIKIETIEGDCKFLHILFEEEEE